MVLLRDAGCLVSVACCLLLHVARYLLIVVACCVLPDVVCCLKLVACCA